ncbi:hypothetical protein N7532_009639 [Penicillium argentinense]|uniref:RTA1 domain protein n=1 Tax=Penicillium argentinense TaxID=1131581 RepID=A0A9W9EZW2_9EURO|nr:uncharacterized protein N7532_009639 [Penicillium argentinense]KAJ5090955.1 hypothetical protein N7532_009639 [Penicillium argentinense]
MSPTKNTSQAFVTASASSTATCLPIDPGKNGHLPPEACGVILLYKPSLAAAVVFFVLFALTTLIHFVQVCIHRKLYALVIVMGSGWEFIAMACRAMETRHQDSSKLYMYFTVFFLVAPIWINAFLYMTLGRMVQFFVPEQRLVRISARRFGLIFVCLDIFAFIIQLIGVGILVQTDAKMDTVMLGVHIYMAGIGIQESFIVCFLALTIHLHRKLLHMENTGLQPMDKLARGPFNWRFLFYTLYFSLTMITIRIAFRLAEYSKGVGADEPTNTHEWYQYVFDALPMFLAVLILNVLHPGRILQGPDSGFRHAKKMAKMEKKERRFRQQNPTFGNYGVSDSIPLAPRPTAQAAVHHEPPQPAYYQPPRSYFL